MEDGKCTRSVKRIEDKREVEWGLAAQRAIKFRARALKMPTSLTVASHGSLAVLASLTVTFKYTFAVESCRIPGTREQKDNDYKIGDNMSLESGRIKSFFDNASFGNPSKLSIR